MYLKPEHARLTLFGGEANFGNGTRHFLLITIICRWLIELPLLGALFRFEGVCLRGRGGYYTIIFLETKGLGSRVGGDTGGWRVEDLEM